LLLGYGFQARACIYVYLLGLVVLPIAGEVQKVTSSNHLSENLFFELKGTGTRIKHNERNQDFPVKEVRIYNESRRACTAGAFHIANQTTKHICSNINACSTN
jgi:hypothetical protein